MSSPSGSVIGCVVCASPPIARLSDARELRDRWLEKVNSGALISHGKYEVGRELPAAAPARAALLAA